ncbi:MAG: DUF1570 domain-containing protein [Gemmataceae bacterium]
MFAHAEVSMVCSPEAIAGNRRPGLRRWPALLALLLALVITPLGCHPVGFVRPRDKVSDTKVDRTTASDDQAALPSKYSFRIAPYVFTSDFEISRDQALFTELDQLRDQVYKELLLPPGTAEVRVYLFDTRERYERYMKERYPDLPERRAFFVAQPRSIGGVEDLLVYTYWGKRIRQDLRHELTHALLHSVIRDVPLWLDEGLAEYFELPPDQKGVNRNHVEILRRGIVSGAYKTDLARLERLRQVDDMNPAEYREAWAWVHFMLNSKPEARTVLLSYLQQLRGSRHPGALGAKLEKVFPDLERAWNEHLAALDTEIARDRAESFTQAD